MPSPHGMLFDILPPLVRMLSHRQANLADPLDLYFSYRLLLERKPDAGGWKAWRRALRKGIPRKNLVDSFLSSAEFRQRYEKPPVLVQTDYGFVIFVDPDDMHIGRGIVASRTYEPHVTAVLRRELQEHHVFLDIGANMGWFTLLAASILHAGRVIAIEPNYDDVQLLYRSLLENGFANVCIFPYAATETDVVLQLNRSRSNAYVAAAGRVDHNATYVQGVRLDALLKDEPRIDVIKMDIEGHEPLALKGMQNIIRQHHPLIISEFHPKAMREYFTLEARDYLEAIIALDYRLSVIAPNGDELPFTASAEILEHWRAYNRKMGSVDDIHLDILARPV